MGNYGKYMDECVIILLQKDFLFFNVLSDVFFISIEKMSVIVGIIHRVDAFVWVNKVH